MFWNRNLTGLLLVVFPTKAVKDDASKRRLQQNVRLACKQGSHYCTLNSGLLMIVTHVTTTLAKSIFALLGKLTVARTKQFF